MRLSVGSGRKPRLPHRAKNPASRYDAGPSSFTARRQGADFRFGPRKPEARHVLPSLPNQSPPGHRSGHGLHGHGGDRGDHRRHRDAADRVAARRPGSLQLGLRFLPAGADRDDRRLRQVVRPVRAQAGDVHRHRHLSRGLGIGRLLVVDAGDDRVPPGPGRRRGRHPAGGAHDRRRPVFAARERQGAGLPRQRLGGVGGDRPDGRRADRPPALMGLDLLDERAHRHRRSVFSSGASCARRRWPGGRRSTWPAPCSSP